MKDHDDSTGNFDPKNAFAGITEKLETAAANLRQAAANMRRTAEVQKANAAALRALNEKLQALNEVLKRSNERFRAAAERLRGGQPAAVAVPPSEPAASADPALDAIEETMVLRLPDDISVFDERLLAALRAGRKPPSDGS